MTLDELKAAANQIRAISVAPEGERHGALAMRLLRMESLLATVGRALLDPSPLSASVLEGLGFENAEVAGDAKRWILHVAAYALHANKLEYSGWFFQASPIPCGHVFNAFPQPKSVGQLLRLLLTLEENEER
jgi:hypothetical protein